MAATRVQFASNQGSAASLAVGSTQGWAAPTAGNLLVAWANSDATVTVNNSMTAGPSVVDGNGVYIWYKIATGAESSFTFTPSVSDSICAGVIEYSGIAASPFDVQNSSTVASADGTSTTAVSVTGTNSTGDLFVAVAGLHRETGPVTSPSWTNGFTNFVSNTAGTNPTACSTLVADFQNTSAATVTTAASWTVAMADRQELLIAFKLGAGGGGGATDGGRMPPLSFARGLPPRLPFKPGLPAFRLPRFTGGKAATVTTGTGVVGTAKVATMAETASGTTLAGNTPSGLADGDLVLVSYAASATPANTSISSGWTGVSASGLTAGQLAFSTWTLGGFYKLLGPGEAASFTPPTVTINAAGRISVSVIAYSGVDPTTPFDVTGQAATTGTTSVSVPSITTVTASDRVFGASAMDASSAANITPPSEMTSLSASTGTGRRLVVAADTIDPAAGATGTRTWVETGTTNLAIAAFTIALRPAPGVTPPSVTPFIGWGWGVKV